ncbi:DUF1656 domain-containing protein [Methylobacterium sp. Leaf118]|uniref:DUF1656 domain-containing protein n=1 Tax=Methylobacterium sp. Leaf118 TaxID=2876562 RepID=UPI001E624E1E|nr:DUF1656 domain-containing protein [Methylobacterium sp. Leaf118]
MPHDLPLGGVLVSRFVFDALIAFAILLALRVVFRRIRFARFVANPPLAEAGLYVCVLALIVVLL